MSRRARDTKDRIKGALFPFTQMGLNQNKKLCMAKENISKMKREPIVWENIFVSDTLDKGLISKVYKELT